MTNTSPIADPSASDPPPDCPELEDLAAFADGTLLAEKRAAVERHLVACERCLEVVSETLHFLDQDAGEKGAAEVPFSRPSGAWPWFLAVAAAALIAVVGFGVWRAQRGSFDLEALTARLPPGQSLDQALGPVWSSPGWSVFRGSVSAETPGAKASFRLGAHAVEIALGVRQRDVLTSRRAAAQIEAIEVEDQLLLLLLQLQASSIAESLSGDEPKWAAAEETTRDLLDEQLSGPLDRFRVLGQWAMSARIASLLRDDQYFESRPWRKGLAGLDEIELSEAAAESAALLRELPADEHARRLELLASIFRELGG